MRHARHPTVPESTTPSEQPDRARRAQRVLRLLDDFGTCADQQTRLLDIGCRQGGMSAVFASRAGEVFGVDIDAAAVAHAKRRSAGTRNLHFVAADAMQLPFPDLSFDIIVCNHVYEHVNDAQALMGEIHRVLRETGVCYFAGGHSLQLIEPHHRLPLLSWLPRPLASLVVRATGKGSAYAETFLAPWRMKSLFRRFSRADWLTGAVIRDAARYELLPTRRPLLELLLKRTPAWTSWLAPTYLWLLRK